MPESFKYYPNPAQNELTVELNLNEVRGIEIQILNVLGEQVISRPLNTNTFKTIEKLSLNHLSSGVYLVIIKDKDNLLLSDKLLVVKND